MTVQNRRKGITYAVKKAGNAVGYCALSICVGTRDEGEFHEGIAHFVEHTLFKGTSQRNTKSINDCLEKLGGELNAFTTKEEIVLHATVLKEHLEKAAALLMEIAFDAQFPEEEIEVEKGVVIDEIASYKDSPSEDVYDSFEEKIFKGHALSRSILGTEESVRAITSEELRRFKEAFFTPDRMAFTMVSPLSENKMRSIIAKVAAKYNLELRGTSGCGIRPRPAKFFSAGKTSFNESVDKDNNEANCVIGGRAPSLYCEKERFATILLCNMLGGPASSSILGNILREKNGWVYNVECSYTPYSDDGVAVILFGCDKENLLKCRKKIKAELKKLQDKQISEARLTAAKRQLLGQNMIGMENGESQCISMGKSLIAFGEIAEEEELARKVNSVTAEQLQDMARKIFSEDNVNSLTYY